MLLNAHLVQVEEGALKDNYEGVRLNLFCKYAFRMLGQVDIEVCQNLILTHHEASFLDAGANDKSLEIGKRELVIAQCNRLLLVLDIVLETFHVAGNEWLCLLSCY